MKALGALYTIACIVGIGWNIWHGWRSGDVVGPRPRRARSRLARVARLTFGGFAFLAVIALGTVFVITVILAMTDNWRHP